MNSNDDETLLEGTDNVLKEDQRKVYEPATCLSGYVPTGFHPAAARKFDVFYIRGKTGGRMQIRNDVKVIFHAVDAVQFFVVLRRKSLFAVFGAEDDLIKDLPVGVHAQEILVLKDTARGSG